MQVTTVRTTGAIDEADAIETIVRAFAADPVARWVWPDPEEYMAAMPSFSRAFAGGAFLHGSAYCSEDYVGVALWLPPDAHADSEALDALVERTVREAIRAELVELMGRMANCHPNEPHWYLPMIGVLPGYQGKGYGGILLKHALEQCDREHLPAYLESSNPRNISLYRRYGFEVMRIIQVGSSPPVVPMLRLAH
jgi:GNAT superfamily N-acetyltransferase